MNAKPTLRSFLALSGCALLVVSQSQAAYYYWDTNGNAAGLGDTAGTWGTSAFHALVNAPNGRGVLGGTLAPGATATTSADSMNFGTINLGLGSAASTIGIGGGGVIVNNITFGFGQGNAVTLSGGGGAITMAGTNPIIYVNNASDTIEAVLTGTAGASKAGPGTLLLTGANTYTGTTSVIGGGTLNVGNGTSGNLNNTTPTGLTFNNGGGTFNVAQADTSSQGMGALTFTGGHGTITTTAASATATQTVTFASLAARGLGSTGNFSLATNTTAADNRIVLTDTTNAPLDSGSNNAGLYFGTTEFARYDSVNGYFRAVIHGTDANAPAALSGTDLGATTSVTDVKLNGNITAQTTAAVNTIHLDGNSLALQDVDQVVDVGGILSNAGSITAGKLQGLTGGGEIVFNVTGGDLSVASTIQDSRVTKTGAGTLTLSGANTYSGTTTVNSGTLAVSGGAAISDTGAVVLANAAGSTFKLNANETIGNLTGGGFSGGTVDVQGNTLTFGDGGNQLFGGTFTGTAGGAITKQGSGTLSLSNVNTFAGTTNLNAGTLTFTLGNSGTTSAQSLSSGGAINMADLTTMAFFPTNQVALGQNTGNAISQLVAPNAWTIGNAINITSGTATFRFTQNGNRWNFTGAVTGGTSGTQTLNILQGTPTGGGGDSQAILFSGVIQDGTGGSTLGVNADFTASSGVNQTAFINLSGQNTFTGPLSVANTRGLTNGAFLVIGGDRTSNNATTGVTAGSGSLGTTSPGTGNYTNTISLATGTILDFASSANQTLGGAISGTGAILKEGAGTLTLSGPSTFNFTLPGSGTPALTTGVAIRAGTLSVGSLNSVVGGSASSHLGAPTTVAAGTIAIGNTVTAGQLTYTGTGEATDRVIDLKGTTGGATIDQSGISGMLEFTSNLTATGNGIKTLTLQGSTAGTGEIAGNIVNSASATSVAKSGSGTWTLSGSNNTYTGTTTVNEGTLLINNATGSGTGGGNVSVTLGTLGGNGSITGSVTIGNNLGSADAILAPGNSIDSIDTGALTFNGDGRYAVELNGTSATTDVTNVTGTVTINTGATLAVSVAGTLSAAQQFVIVSNDGMDLVGGDGAFAGLAQDAVFDNYGTFDLKISYTGGDGNDIVLYTSAAGGNPYDTWATGNEDFNDDANLDGVDDGLAWFLTAATPSANAADKVPVPANDGAFLTLDFDRVNPYAPAKLYVQFGNDLTGWTEVEIPAASGTINLPGDDVEVVVTSPGAPTPDSVTVKIPASYESAPGTLFARLRATEN